MYIRRVSTGNKATGESYFSYRLVRSERVGGKVRQSTLLNLGRHFSVNAEHWPLLCTRIEEILTGQRVLLPMSMPAVIEEAAQHYAARLVVTRGEAPAVVERTASSPSPQPSPSSPSSNPPVYQEVEVDSLALLHPRSVGVEHVGLHVMAQVELIDKLAELGVNGTLRAAIVGNLIARMAQPASENATYEWLRRESALGELLDVDFETMPLMRLYRGSDALLRHREAIEHHLFERLSGLFGLETTVTLYDLTNTYFEGEAAGNELAKFGRSKEKRSDCRLVTLGLVLDGSGFVRRSQMFAGNAAEARTLEDMLTGLHAPPGALVIMDAGIATQANIEWLVAQGYRYLVVSRSRQRQFEGQDALTIETQSGQPLQLQRELSADGREVRLYCYSPAREQKERGMVGKFTQRFEAGLQKIVEGLHKPRAEKRLTFIQQRMGRLKERSRGSAQHYRIDLQTDETGETVTALTWQYCPVEGTQATHPGVYCLRSNALNWDAEQLWRTYSLLTDLEAVFRSLKDELGLRPIYHHRSDRTDGHLFITVLAYQLVHLIRTQLKARGIDDSWGTLRGKLTVQRRVTARFRQRDGFTLHVRKSTEAEPEARAIYDALGLDAAPGGTRKLIR